MSGSVELAMRKKELAGLKSSRAWRPEFSLPSPSKSRTEI